MAISWVDVLTSWYLGIELIIGASFLCIRLPRRSYMLPKWCGFTAAILLLSTYFMGTWVWNDQMLIMREMLKDLPVRIIISFLAFLQIWVCYVIFFWDAFYIFTIIYTLQKLEFSIYKIVEEAINIILPEANISDYVLLVINYVLFIIFCYIIQYIFLNQWKEIHIRRENSFALCLVLAINMGSDLINMYIWANDPYANFGTTMIAMRLFGILFNLVTVYMLYNLIDRLDLQIEKATLEAISRQRMNQYAFSQDLINTINIKSHDLKKQIRYLKNHENASKELFQELENYVESYDSILETRNDTLSTVLTEKSMICHQNNIPFSCIADGDGMEFMKELDIYTLCANLMDNAIEASLALPDGNRSIELIVKRQGNFISIREENYCSENVTIRGGVPVTTKKDVRYHGFGVKSMSQIIQKYDGTINMEIYHNRYKVNILIPIPEN